MKQIINDRFHAELHGDLITLYRDGNLIKAFTVRMNDAVDHFKAFVEKAKVQLEPKTESNGK